MIVEGPISLTNRNTVGNSVAQQAGNVSHRANDSERTGSATAGLTVPTQTARAATNGVRTTTACL